MENLTPYCYKALNVESYNALAAHVVASPIDASFFPKLLTIVVTPREGDEAEFLEIGKFIDAEGLDFHINPVILNDECRGEIIDCEVTPSCILRDIIYRLLEEKAHETNDIRTELAKCKDELAVAKSDADNRYRWWRKEEEAHNRIKTQMNAIRTLMDEILKD